MKLIIYSLVQTLSLLLVLVYLGPVSADDEIVQDSSEVLEVHRSTTTEKPEYEIKTYEALEVINKSPSGLAKLRGFGAEVHYAKTKDGYHIHVLRLINPEIEPHKRRRPIIFNHGLLESSTIWLINAHKVKPLPFEHQCGQISFNQLSANETQYLNGPMMLANHGYDVWLMSMRGTDWSLKHDFLKPKEPKFWDYCLDDFALVDIPTVIDYVQRKTGRQKIGYIGHSQATFSIFGLLATRPSYADIVEPVIAVAPVAFFDHITSVSRLLFLGTLTATDKDDHGPFPKEAKNFRSAFAQICKGPNQLVKMTCNLIESLVGGKGDKWLKGYFNHLPFFTSLKVLRHFGQLIKSKRYQMYDYGDEENLRIYGTKRSPAYNIRRIRSKYLCLISTKSDALSPPKDVDRFRKRLTVPLFRDIFIEGDFDHFNLITSADAKDLVFKPIMEIFEEIESKADICEAIVSPQVEYPGGPLLLDEFSGQIGPNVHQSPLAGQYTNQIGSNFKAELDQLGDEASVVNIGAPVKFL